MLERRIVSLKRVQELTPKSAPETPSTRVSPGGKKQSSQMRVALESQVAQLQAEHASELEQLQAELAKRAEDLKGAVHCAMKPGV
jgi:hypothetical protein